MRPHLDPALPLVWRDDAVLQVGLDPAYAVAVHGAPPHLPSLLGGLRGRDRLDDVLAAVPSPGPTREALHSLASLGLLSDGAPGERWASSWVHVVGAGPVAATVAGRLRGEGLGRCTVSSGHSESRPDLVVVAPSVGRGLDAADPLMAAGTPHLWAHVRDGRAVVGPLVVPGRSACLRCQDLHRTDSDPAWPRLAMAWEVQPHRPGADLVGRLTGAVAARQVLAWLAGRAVACWGGTLEEQPDGSLLRTEWPPHPGCGCAWHWVGATGLGDG